MDPEAHRASLVRRQSAFGIPAQQSGKAFAHPGRVQSLKSQASIEGFVPRDILEGGQGDGAQPARAGVVERSSEQGPPDASPLLVPGDGEFPDMQSAVLYVRREKADRPVLWIGGDPTRTLGDQGPVLCLAQIFAIGNPGQVRNHAEQLSGGILNGGKRGSIALSGDPDVGHGAWLGCHKSQYGPAEVPLRGRLQISGLECLSQTLLREKFHLGKFP
jgi:hypothetical protein